MSWIDDNGSHSAAELKAADYVIRLRGVRPGDDYWEIVSDEGLVTTCATFAEAVAWCEAHE